ncbi:MAG TPA: asparagine synthase (glutamine-hydrolyzing) [Longimicrobium sp.]|nr:asparagine synthase (glutamine-hydrolyzing) [Longimicrobium sp.]
MCGIAGSLALGEAGRRVDAGLLGRMRDRMAHRGPDGAGMWVSEDGGVGLAHRRLSIIDLSHAADQPMENEDGSLRIVFNGEIYNHAEIRAELEKIGGHRWRTDHSDTEVILHAFEEWGISCLHRFRGMFAFALWDGRERALWLVRDRVGVKPLYYSALPGRLNFASEIKALLADPAQPREVDPESLFHYLSFLTVPAPHTMFAGIRKLPPGTWLRIAADGGMREERYWDAWDAVQPLRNASEDEIAARVLDELRTAVKLRKVSDVPVGVFLSGGIDSSTNAALFSEGGGPVKTFSIGYDREYESYASELPYARAMAERVGAEHHERLLSVDDMIDFLPRMVQLQDEPIADPVCVPVYYVSELARKNGVIVCQVGEGADELFCGYPAWQRYLKLQALNRAPVPRIAKRAGVKALAAVGRGETFYTEYLQRGADDRPVFWGGAEAFPEAYKRRLLGKRLRRELDGLTSWDALAPIRKRFEEKAWETSDLNWMTYLDLNLRLPELLLMRVDKMSMGVSLEGRVPFLDHKFVELALGIPSAMKLKGGELKHVLKKAVRGVIPDEVIDRKKQGFGAPIHEWFFDRLGQTARAELDEFCRKSDLLDRDAVMSVLDRGKAQQSWFLLNFALWWKEYVA